MGAGANSLGGGAIDLLGSSFWADPTTPYVVAEYRPGAGGVFYRMCPSGRLDGWNIMLFGRSLSAVLARTLLTYCERFGEHASSRPACNR